MSSTSPLSPPVACPNIVAGVPEGVGTDSWGRVVSPNARAAARTAAVMSPPCARRQ
ncbi:MAG: hypothetical protein MZU84_02535 [Sphingobacterium sp.]|nr:hypothetical protein [Sphingobacterium sp.]